MSNNKINVLIFYRIKLNHQKTQDKETYKPIETLNIGSKINISKLRSIYHRRLHFQLT